MHSDFHYSGTIATFLITLILMVGGYHAYQWTQSNLIALLFTGFSLLNLFLFFLMRSREHELAKIAEELHEYKFSDFCQRHNINIADEESALIHYAYEKQIKWGKDCEA